MDLRLQLAGHPRRGGVAGGPFQFASANFNFKGPLAFIFSEQSGVALNTLIESQPVTIAGLASNTSNTAGISISGGEYEVSTDGGTTYGAYTSSAGTLTGVAGNSLNDKIKVKVRHTSSASNSTPTNTILKIGLHSDTFTSTTEALVCDTNDTTPDNFPFTNQTDVALGAVIESAPITVTGICTGVNITISVSGGEYAISTDGGTTYGAYTSSAGTVTKHNRVKVRHTRFHIKCNCHQHHAHYRRSQRNLHQHHASGCWNRELPLDSG